MEQQCMSQILNTTDWQRQCGKVCDAEGARLQRNTIAGAFRQPCKWSVWHSLGKGDHQRRVSLGWIMGRSFQQKRHCARVPPIGGQNNRWTIPYTHTVEDSARTGHRYVSESLHLLSL